MTTVEVAPSPWSPPVATSTGPALLAHLEDGPGLAVHRERYGAIPHLDAATLIAATRAASLRGRGGAGFPFATKLDTTLTRRRRVVVVNAAEGEPASAKDETLLRMVPHRVLDGAALTAAAVRTREIHVVTGAERPETGEAVLVALAERQRAGERLHWHWHEVDTGFVGGQAHAVIELLSGRVGLPVTAWQPAAVSGVRGRPTLLSNAETWAHVWAAAHRSTGSQIGPPDTVLLTLTEDGRRRVVEVLPGTPWDRILSMQNLGGPVLLGGYHGTWVPPGALRDLTVDRDRLAAAGLSLGAGVVLTTDPSECPVRVAAAITATLAAARARRCGPCDNGLPTLAAVLDRLASTQGTPDDLVRVADLCGLVTGRGACAHPDGTARMVQSLLTAFHDEVQQHATGRCAWRGRRG